MRTSRLGVLVLLIGCAGTDPPEKLSPPEQTVRMRLPRPPQPRPPPTRDRRAATRPTTALHAFVEAHASGAAAWEVSLTQLSPPLPGVTGRTATLSRAQSRELVEALSTTRMWPPEVSSEIVPAIAVRLERDRNTFDVVITADGTLLVPGTQAAALPHELIERIDELLDDVHLTDPTWGW